MKFKQYLTGLNEDEKSDIKARSDFAEEAVKALKGNLQGYLNHYFARMVSENEYVYAPVGFKIPFKISGIVTTYDKDGTSKETERLVTSEIQEIFKKDKFSAVKTKSGNVYILIIRESGYQKWLDSVGKFSI